MRVLISADCEGVTRITATNELMYGRLFAALLLGWSATDEVYG
jgi:D-aminopeptidase